MANPWEMDWGRAAVQNDVPATALPRAPVQSSQRVWGDREAEAAGVYEAPQGAPWQMNWGQSQQAQPQSPQGPLQITVNPLSVAERFGAMQPPASGADAMQRGLNETALNMTRGPQLSPAAQMAGEMANLVPAASQGTTPHVSGYGGRVVSTEAFEDDGGNILYRDPQTGEVKPTNNATQVALRDPTDGVVKVFERSPETDESAVTGVSRVLAPGLGAGAPTARAAIGATRVPDVRASDIFSTAKPSYRAFKNEAGKIEIPEETAVGMAAQLRRALDGANLIPELAPPVYSAIGILEKGEPLTLDALQNVKRVVGRGFNSPDKNVRDAAAVASGEIGKIISQVSKSASDNLKTGDAIHSTARSVQDLQRKFAVADLRTGRAGYGGNAVNTIRQVLSPIVQKAIEGRTTGFRSHEIAAMRQIVEGTKGVNALRRVGAMSPSRGANAILLGGLTLGTASVLGASANKLAAVLTSRQIEKLSDVVARRSPAYAESVAKATERYERAQMELINKPTPNTWGAYLSASRELAGRLQSGGVTVTSGDLLKAIKGPMQSAAEGEEPAVPRVPGQ